MRRVRQLAEQTPESRERFVDLLRAVAITAVVLGHWLVIDIGYDRHGQLTGHSALSELPWARPVTWLVQVMPVFFLVGGFANAASLTRHQRGGGDATGWLLHRSVRLIRPTTILLVTLAAGGLIARLLGAAPQRIHLVVWFASIPLWFLAAYLAMVLLTPVMYPLHRRFGVAVPLLLVALVALGDLARLRGSTGDLGGFAAGNYLFGWLAVHQAGFAWEDGRLPAKRRVGVPLLLVGVAGLLLLTLAGPYPVSMINVPGERIHNTAPPSLALLALAIAQLGLILLLRGPADRWLRRPRPWRLVVAANSVVLTIFLWHISAVLLLIGGLDLVGLLPTAPVGSTAWLLWRLPWLLMLLLVLSPLVAIFARFETHGAPHPTGPPRWLPARLAGALARPGPRAALTAAGFTATVVGLAGNAMAPKHAAYLFGIPTGALIAYLLGALVLRLLRSVPEHRP
ncbi:MAG TPA: acyltransferase [Micromonosporaceae bacterium]|nr:acyltransferase [Micromonosporaceae bacterium]